MHLRFDCLRPNSFLAAVLFVLFLSLSFVKAQANNPQCQEPAQLNQSEKAKIIENVRQIIGGYDPDSRDFHNLKNSWYTYFNCVETPAIQRANNLELDELHLKIAQSALSAIVQSLNLSDETAEAKSITAEIMILTGRPASKFIQEAIALDPQNSEANFLLGILNSDLASIDRTIVLNPSFAPAYNLKAELLLAQAAKSEGTEQQVKYQTALKAIKTMLALPAPPQAEFWREQYNSLLVRFKDNSLVGQPAKPQTATNAQSGVGAGPSKGQEITTGNGIGGKTGNGIGIGATGGQNVHNQTSTVNATDSNRRLNILSKPRANYTELARITQTEGTVRIRVTFAANGEIKDVLAISFLPFGLTQQAAKAAKQLKFEPEIRNNAPVSVSKMIEYNFNLY